LKGYGYLYLKDRIRAREHRTLEELEQVAFIEEVAKRICLIPQWLTAVIRDEGLYTKY